ncbi:MAG: DNA repair protein RecN [Rhizobiaceae bacterium]
MLSALSIRDIVLIRRLDLSFDGGLAVLSGETGAGKSILLDALSLALGARGDGDLVRVDEKQGQVSAIFDVEPNHAVFDLISENGLDVDTREDGIILRRTQNADGRTRAFINDQPVSVSLLKEVGQMLVEIHGQHEERAMVDPVTHRDLVDAFGSLHEQRAAVAEAHRAWRQLQQKLKTHENKLEQASRDADYLRSSVEELTLLDPQEGEEEELAGRRQTMMAAETIASDLDEAYQVLAGQTSPMPTLISTLRKLERKSSSAPGLLDDTIECFGVAVDALAQAETELERAVRLSEFDPLELERAEERLFALRAAARKYKVPVEGLSDHAEQLSQDLAALDAGEDQVLELQKQVHERRKELEDKAEILTARRMESSALLAEKVMQELPALKLEQAEFFVDLRNLGDEISEAGRDCVEFHVKTNPGTRPGAMMKVASGGELSRFLLALKVALADRGSAPTLVFDEIDTGVGGAVADAIGARLANLSRHVQVLSVTHAPQVAARAAAHLLISKGAEEQGDETIETKVEPIDGDARLEEIARMLSGAKITSEARAAAASLLDQ